MDDLTIDREFASLCPPLNDDELLLLNSNIRRDGCREPIIIWANHGGIILDGHHRYKICKKYGLSYKTKALNFSTREECMRWIICNQLGRRNLSESQRSMLGAKLVTAARGGDRDGKSDSANLPNRNEITQSEAADIVNVSTRSVTAAAKVLEEGDKSLVKAVEADEITVSVAAAVAELPPAQQKAAVAKGEEGMKAAAKKVREKKTKAKADDFDTKAMDAKPPKNGAVRKEFDDHAVEQLFGKLIRLIDDRHAEVGGAAHKYRICVSTLRTAHTAWKDWCKS